MSRILILDDDPHIERTLGIMLRRDGHTVFSAASGEEALELLERECADIALVDLQLPGMDGIEFLKGLRERHRDVDAMVITAHGSIETAVGATQVGAFDYLTKPFAPEEVRHRLAKIEEFRRLKREVAGLRQSLDAGDEMITRHPPLRHTLEIARDIAQRDVTVLITGESGTGKSLLARMMHRWSARREGELVLVDCASLKDTLLESELFGHVKGAFTGAVAEKRGKVELAEGGTLFLDEIGEIPLELQAKLLRLVEDRTFERVGDPQVRAVNTRIIAATNRNIEAAVEEETFRADLFYRLSVFEIYMPPLRQRPEDIAALATRFVQLAAARHNKNAVGIDERAMALLLSYAWPGNVRELANTLERAVLLCAGSDLSHEHLPERFQKASCPGTRDDAVLPLAAMEAEHIRRALARGLSQEETAEILGIAPSTLWRKCKRYGI